MKKILSVALAAMMFASTFVIAPAQAAEFQGGTVLTTHDGSPVTLLPDFNEDKSKERAAIRDGGFETKAAFNDNLQLIPYWTAGGMTFEESDAVEGKLSLVVDYPKITADVRGEAGFTAVYLAPCFTEFNEAYCLEFYTKLLTPLDGNPEVLIYFFNPEDSSNPAVGVGTSRVTINAETMKGTEWEAQKWIRVRHYFTIDSSADEKAWTLQIQNMNMSGPWGTSRIALDGFSLTKVSIDEATMDPSLFKAEEPVVEKSVKFTKKSVKIKKGKKATLKVKIQGASKAKFSVDKKGKNVVKLSKKKAKSVVVTGTKKGNATITAKVGAKKATCKVNVK